MGRDDAMIEEYRRIFGEQWRDPVPGKVSGDAFYHGPVPEEMVADAERELGVAFPPSYRTFLLHFGAGFIGSNEISGLSTEERDGAESHFWSSVVEDSKTAWSGPIRDREGLPRHLVYLNCDGGELSYFLDSSMPDDAGEYPVVRWGPIEHPGEIIAPNFLEFVRWIEREHQRYLEWKKDHPSPPLGFDWKMDIKTGEVTRGRTWK